MERILLLEKVFIYTYESDTFLTTLPTFRR